MAGWSEPMELILTTELQEFIAREVARGRYPNAQEVVADGLRILMDVRQSHEEWRAEIQQRLAQIENGEYREYTEETLGTLFDEIEAEIEQKERAAKRRNQGDPAA